ncbi:MAG: glycosyltransferase family 1 protein [Planctomycetota bacterium]|nr:MAG: glycosyltransferase family 1 protein [Planctomycetota bacterium]REK24688.1 MAG: glycosyltransferase family 1 protein [Planctomycetota bacterium]REK40187.1 MAG: glycosyltransferase family 1 protein [Planctomycetota bacterium]
MRIAIIAEVFLPKVDGVVVRTMNLIEHLQRSGDEVLVVCPEAEGRRDCSVPVVEFRSFPFPTYPEYRIGLPDQRLVTAVRDFAPDVVHYINPFAFGFRCYDRLRKGGLDLPNVFSFHTLYGEFVKRYGVLKPLSRMLWWLTREYHNCADLNLTVSAIMREELIRRGFERVECWPPAVDSALFQPERENDEMRRRIAGGECEKPLLLTVSRLAPEKNVAFLADVLEQAPGARLAIIGDGPQREELERRFANVDAHFVGYLQGAELAAAYASADAFIYASETETMGNVVLEAMASGLPVIAPAAGGIPSLVVHGETGLLFAPGQLDEAVGHVQAVLTDEALRERLGASARQTVQAWDWNNSVETVRQSYLNSIEQHGRRNGRRVPGHHLARATVGGLVMAFRAVPRRRKKANPISTTPA